MDDRSAASRGARRLARGTAVFVVVIALLGAATWLGRRPLAAGLARLALARAGFANVALTVADVGLDGIELRDVRAPGSALEIASLRARWSVAERTIDALEARGVRLRADLRSAPAGATGPDPARLAAAALALPRNVRLDDATVAVETDVGSFALALRANLAESDGELRGNAALELTREGARAELVLELQGAPERLEGKLGLDARADDPELPLALAAKGEARLAWRDRVLELHIPECVALRVERASLGSLHLAAPLVACAGQGQGPALRVELPEGERTRYRGELPIRADEASLAFGAGDAVALREPRLALLLETPAEASGPELRLQASGESAESRSLELRAETWKIEGRSAGGALESSFEARTLRDLRKPANILPIALRGTASRPQAGVPLAVRFELTGAGGRAHVDGKGTLEPEAGSARLQLALRPLTIGPEGARLAELSPVLDRMLGAATGRLEGRAEAHFGAKGPEIDVDLALRDAAFTTRAARFRGVNGRVLLQGPSPWSTPPDQLVAAALTEVGLPLTDGLIRFQLRPDGMLNVASATFSMLGGEVRIPGPFDLGSARRALALEVRALDVTEIAKASELKGFSGTGKLDGRIPLRLADGEVRFDAADLHSTGAGGTIQYRRTSDGRSGKTRPEILLALSALEDFRYEELRITLDGDVNQKVTAGLFIRGANPNLQSGRTVEFNVKVEAPMSALLRSSLASYRLPEVVERKLREFPGAELR